MRSRASTPAASRTVRPGSCLRRQVEDFVFAFDSNLFPIVGQQITLTGSNGAVAGPRIDLLIARAGAGECDLVVKGQGGGREIGFLYAGAGAFTDGSRGPRRRSRTRCSACSRARPGGS